MASTIKFDPRASTITRKLRCGTCVNITVIRSGAVVYFRRIGNAFETLSVDNHADARKLLRDIADVMEWQKKAKREE